MSELITKKDLKKVYLRQLTLQASWSYERMQALGFANSIMPILKKVYKDDEEGMRQALKRHMEFFNTCPNYGVPPILGITAALEEQKAEPDMIRGIKTGMMGPLAGVGDTIMWAILGPLFFSIPASMALANDISGAYVSLLVTQILFITWNLFVKWKLLELGYEKGTDLATSTESVMEKVTFGAGVLGLIVVGGLIPSIVNVTTPLQWIFGGYEFVLQNVIDSLFPKLISILFVAGIFYLLRNKRWSPVKIVILLFAVCTVLGALGIII